MQGAAPGFRTIGPVVYVRFHGPEKYTGGYSDRRLAEWSAWCAARVVEAVPAYAYFNNDIGGHAPRDAVRFREMTLLRGTVASCFDHPANRDTLATTMDKPRILTAKELRAIVPRLAGWKLAQNKLSRTFEFRISCTLSVL